jgi:hypothetical protein
MEIGQKSVSGNGGGGGGRHSDTHLLGWLVEQPICENTYFNETNMNQS